MKNSIYERAKLSRIILKAVNRHLFRWPLWGAIIMSFMIGILLHVKEVKFVSVMREINVQIFNVAIAETSLILAAMAIIIVVYNKSILKQIINVGNGTFEGFIFPYIWGASLWTILAIGSLFFSLFPRFLEIFSIVIVYLGLVIYAICFMLYIIGELIQHVMLSSEIE
ncbi:hypothetical protein FC36_GL002138 [Ligilactobacillus equi DSM 15833 = JCM 10991]|uniref:Uncharacterized protein n=2 Tax=Ligilactobacillus equi TaxID=137357 RepID=A0A0R1TGZ9_9LACO|nr:hypothetical protein FC36_GL002138 [Ligilactobacillus equi DSM 15833 = JCM 10991]